MKLVRYGPPGREKPGIIDAQGQNPDLSEVVPDITGEPLAGKSLNKIRKADSTSCLPGRAARGSAPASAASRNFIAIGLNYADHAKETGAQIPKEPIIFQKAPNCISARTTTR